MEIKGDEETNKRKEKEHVYFIDLDLKRMSKMEEYYELDKKIKAFDANLKLETYIVLHITCSMRYTGAAKLACVVKLIVRVVVQKGRVGGIHRCDRFHQRLAFSETAPFKISIVLNGSKNHAMIGEANAVRIIKVRKSAGIN
ncbi:hypothetical protein CR513_46784, partial [Mucuna pruriens]